MKNFTTNWYIYNTQFRADPAIVKNEQTKK